MSPEIISETIAPESQPTRDHLVCMMAAAEVERALEGRRRRRALIVDAVQSGGVASWSPFGDRSGGTLIIGDLAYNLPLDTAGYPNISEECEAALVDAVNERAIQQHMRGLDQVSDEFSECVRLLNEIDDRQNQRLRNAS